jgi:hypothetical protein
MSVYMRAAIRVLIFACTHTCAYRSTHDICACVIFAHAMKFSYKLISYNIS